MNRPASYEPDRIDTSRLRWVALVSAGSLAAILAIMFALWTPPPRELPRAGAVPPQPRIEPDPHAELLATQWAQQTRLQQYGWNDAGHRFAHIPVQRAMAMMARRGSTASPPTEQP